MSFSGLSPLFSPSSASFLNSMSLCTTVCGRRLPLMNLFMSIDLSPSCSSSLAIASSMYFIRGDKKILFLLSSFPFSLKYISNPRSSNSSTSSLSLSTSISSSSASPSSSVSFCSSSSFKRLMMIRIASFMFLWILLFWLWGDIFFSIDFTSLSFLSAFFKGIKTDMMLLTFSEIVKLSSMSGSFLYSPFWSFNWLHVKPNSSSKLVPKISFLIAFETISLRRTNSSSASVFSAFVCIMCQMQR